MTTQSVAYRAWKAIAVTGACLLAFGTAAFYFDDATNGQFEFISDTNWFGLMTIFGLVLAFVECSGWARHLGKKQRQLMALLAFAMPWAFLILGYPFAGVNFHGPAAGVIMLMIPCDILAVILLLMSA